ncbi:hypothetical protein GCM10009850_118850 [Nonomuraea monospora]|uniref:Uncharacterized protein n=1 Tax=Nonomuraea monospora TaxID=568818 RepID=A0ABN3D3K2_9ACTN
MFKAVRKYRRSSADRIGYGIFRTLTWLGAGPADPLITPGRRTGLPRGRLGVVVRRTWRQWLLALYSAILWVANVHVAGRVTLRRGHAHRDYTVPELQPDEAGPALKRYLAVATRPYFQAGKDRPVTESVAEALRHPLFQLSTPVTLRDLEGSRSHGDGHRVIIHGL